MISLTYHHYFLIFLSMMFSRTSRFNKLLLFAYDNSFLSLRYKLQSDLKIFMQWCLENDLVADILTNVPLPISINLVTQQTTRTKSMVYSYRQNHLSRFLGSLFCQIYKLFDFNDHSVINVLHCSSIRSTIIYIC